MFEQLIGWSSAAIIVWVFVEAILHERGTCVARVVRRAGSAPTWRLHRLETAMRILSVGRRRLERLKNNDFGRGAWRRDPNGWARNTGRAGGNTAKESMR